MSLLLFDLDGTLIDSSPGIFASMEHAFACVGARAPSRERLRNFIGPPLRASFAEVVGEDPARVAQTVAHYRARYDALGWTEHAVYPGIAELIVALAAGGHTLAVVTTKVAPMAQRLLAHLPFGAHFARVYAPDGEASRCEKAEMIAAALRDFGAAAAHATMVGDRHFDIAGARANGVRGLGVAWGFGSAQELQESGAAAIAATPQQLGRLLGLAAPTGPATASA